MRRFLRKRSGRAANKNAPVLSNIGAAIYGLITVGALLAAESASSETYGETVAGVAIALVLYWLAHAYAEFVSSRLQTGQRFTLKRLARAMGQELPIITGASPPLLAVLVCWVAGANLSTAIDAGFWTAATAIVAVEIVAAVRARRPGGELIAQALAGVLFGVLILAVRVVLH